MSVLELAWIDHDAPPDEFPPVESALRDPDGLLAVGGDLSADRLLAAYRRGIFPWYEPGGPILWWCPDPRSVFLPGDLRLSRRTHRHARSLPYRVSFDQAFPTVIRACADVGLRRNQSGTWLTTEMIAAFENLHALGHAHSCEIWIDGALAGGIYGLVIGRVFFGESMFSRQREASKIALYHLDARLREHDFGLIDCQVHSLHLERLGARQIPRRGFLNLLAEYCALPEASGLWPNAPAVVSA
jgi:leucyl/phenylalanyl-tRNA---protein transferase